MINLKKRLAFAMFIFLLITIYGCTGKKDTQKLLDEIRTGTDGISLSFLPNSPPNTIHVEGSENTFTVALEVRNKGAYPQPEDASQLSTFGKVFLSGFDPNIIKFTQKSGSNELSTRILEGKSTLNPNGGLDVLTFDGAVDIKSLNVEKYEPTLLATACYIYETVAGPPVCIDPNPYSATKEKKVCEVQSVTLSNQGAPVAVTRIDEEALAARTQFKITIKNVGNGEALMSYAALSFCDPFGAQKDIKGIKREDVDKVRVNYVKIANIPLQCRPFVDGEVKATAGYVRLINGEGFIICDLPKEQYKDSSTAFTTPLTVRLSYGYRSTAEKKITIKKETNGGESSSGTGGIPDASPTQPSIPSPESGEGHFYT